ncbi:hypothetical protein R0K05_22720, partial [Planococcus sp. SIMBA_160]
VKSVRGRAGVNPDEGRQDIESLKSHVSRVIRNHMEDAAQDAADEAMSAISRIAHRITYHEPKGPR